MEIVPLIPDPKLGFPPTVPLPEIIDAILYKLKTGVQWDQLSVRSLFSDRTLTWQKVYYHFNKWSRSGTFRDCWIKFLKRHRAKLDLLARTLTTAISRRLGAVRAWPIRAGRKRRPHSLYLTDRQGLPLAMSEPVAGNRKDLYDIEVQFEVVTATLEEADIPVEGLFLNADAGFDSKEFRKACGKKEVNANICFNKRNGNGDGDEYFDQKLYDERYAVERTNAWIDSYLSLLNRFDTTVRRWKEFNFLAFIVIVSKKLLM